MEEFQVEQLSLSAGIKWGRSGPKYMNFLTLPFIALCCCSAIGGETPQKEARACPEPGTELTTGVHTRVSQRGAFFTF